MHCKVERRTLKMKSTWMESILTADHVSDYQRDVCLSLHVTQQVSSKAISKAFQGQILLPDLLKRRVKIVVVELGRKPKLQTRTGRSSTVQQKSR